MILERIKSKLHRVMNPINPNVWFTYPNPKTVYGGKKSLDEYDKQLKMRQKKYEFKPSAKAIEYSNEIEEKGYVVIKNFISHEKIDQLEKIVEHKLDTASDLLNVSEPQSVLRPREAFVAINQPFVAVPEIIDVALDPLIIDITSAYLNCYSALGTCNLRKSFVNKLPDNTTQIFHVDPNSPKFLKCFIYFDDVTMEGGPFCFIEGSHRKKFQGWANKYRWDNEEILSVYGEDKVKYLLASKGDLIIADTNGYHRGVKPKTKERTMLTLDYTCHAEGFEDKNRFHFPKSIYDKLDSKLKPIMDFVELV